MDLKFMQVYASKLSVTGITIVAMPRYNKTAY